MLSRIPFPGFSAKIKYLDAQKAMRYKTRGLLNRFSKACEHSRFDNSWDEDCRWGERQHEGHKRTKTAKAPLVFCAICSFGPFVELSSSAIKLFSTVASAQFKAGIQGTVTDSNGAVISGAKVTLVNKETGRKLTTSAGESGFYRITGLAPGEYQVIAERDGFKKSELREIVISAETEQDVAITLEPGQVSETVTISGDSTPRMQTEVDVRSPNFGRSQRGLAGRVIEFQARFSF
jgi:Carboxypeptidase regulatory-like domain